MSKNHKPLLNAASNATTALKQIGKAELDATKKVRIFIDEAGKDLVGFTTLYEERKVKPEVREGANPYTTHVNPHCPDDSVI